MEEQYELIFQNKSSTDGRQFKNSIGNAKNTIQNTLNTHKRTLPEKEMTSNCMKKKANKGSKNHQVEEENYNKIDHINVAEIETLFSEDNQVEIIDKSHITTIKIPKELKQRRVLVKKTIQPKLERKVYSSEIILNTNNYVPHTVPTYKLGNKPMVNNILCTDDKVSIQFDGKTIVVQDIPKITSGLQIQSLPNEGNDNSKNSTLVSNPQNSIPIKLPIPKLVSKDDIIATKLKNKSMKENSKKNFKKDTEPSSQESNLKSNNDHYSIIDSSNINKLDAMDNLSSECSVFNCNNIGGHSFPEKNPLRKQWMDFTKDPNINLNINCDSVICVDHFLDINYYPFQPPEGQLRTILKKSAVPSIYVEKTA